MMEESKPHPVRNTARGIVVHEDKILLMERWRSGMHYFSIPGGGIEPGETPEQTVVREMAEETTIIVKVQRHVLEMRDAGISHKIYLCEYISGQPHLPGHAPEALQMNANNRFKPGWQPLESLAELPFIYWRPLQGPLVKGLANGFNDEVEIVSCQPAR